MILLRFYKTYLQFCSNERRFRIHLNWNQEPVAFHEEFFFKKRPNTLFEESTFLKLSLRWKRNESRCTYLKNRYIIYKNCFQVWYSVFRATYIDMKGTVVLFIADQHVCDISL